MNIKSAGASDLYLTGKFTSAIEYARHLHIERRKGSGIPYMAHLLGVAALVMGEAGHEPFPVTEDMVVAALLHDAVEDHELWRERGAHGRRSFRQLFRRFQP